MSAPRQGMRLRFVAPLALLSFCAVVCPPAKGEVVGVAFGFLVRADPIGSGDCRAILHYSHDVAVDFPSGELADACGALVTDRYYEVEILDLPPVLCVPGNCPKASEMIHVEARELPSE